MKSAAQKRAMMAFLTAVRLRTLAFLELYTLNKFSVINYGIIYSGYKAKIKLKRSYTLVT